MRLLDRQCGVHLRAGRAGYLRVRFSFLAYVEVERAGEGLAWVARCPKGVAIALLCRTNAPLHLRRWRHCGVRQRPSGESLESRAQVEAAPAASACKRLLGRHARVRFSFGAPIYARAFLAGGVQCGRARNERDYRRGVIIGKRKEHFSWIIGLSLLC
jgi:hypothetical protein